MLRRNPRAEALILGGNALCVVRPGAGLTDAPSLARAAPRMTTAAPTGWFQLSGSPSATMPSSVETIGIT